jgi:hypothetical protein
VDRTGALETYRIDDDLAFAVPNVEPTGLEPDGHHDRDVGDFAEPQHRPRPVRGKPPVRVEQGTKGDDADRRGPQPCPLQGRDDPAGQRPGLGEERERSVLLQEVAERREGDEDGNARDAVLAAVAVVEPDDAPVTAPPGTCVLTCTFVGLAGLEPATNGL